VASRESENGGILVDKFSLPLLFYAVDWEPDSKRLKCGPHVVSTVCGRAPGESKLFDGARRMPALHPVTGGALGGLAQLAGRRKVFMSRSSWKRAITALLIVMAFTLAVPAKASATAMTMDSAYCSTLKVWTKVMAWLTGLWAAPTTSAPRGDAKFGAGHSSDGLAVSKAGPKAPV
jgi:hypothetical protein